MKELLFALLGAAGLALAARLLDLALRRPPGYYEEP